MLRAKIIQGFEHSRTGKNNQSTLPDVHPGTTTTIATTTLHGTTQPQPQAPGTKRNKDTREAEVLALAFQGYRVAPRTCIWIR